ncbi:MAG TPA: cystathionine gamma-synthase [Acidimicrobiales bacterium]|nr:cystathionine gamma-synthase [Acidimicrobiales bacterium]
MTGFSTRAIHAGQEPDPATGAVTTPVYQTSTFAQEGLGRHKGYEYARTANPTRAALETCIASLEGAAHGLAFASGMAAVDSVIRQLDPGDHILVNRDGYGGTHRLLTQVHKADFTPVDLGDPAAVDRAWTDRTRLVWVESPTNPGLEIVDVAALATLARERGAWCAVDNTFATPYLQRPLDLGAHLVVHSTSKYLSGHSDVIGGFVATDDDDLAAAVTLVRNAAGSVPGPFDCFLVLRGVKTLALRMDRHCDNALAVAGFLAGHPAMEAVSYPGLPDHPGHDLAKRQMAGRFGGMVSCVLRGGEAAAGQFVSRTRLFTLGESLGGVESLVSYPARMSHLSLAGTPGAAAPGLVRLSVGIEDVDDLLEDLAQALATVAPTT